LQNAHSGANSRLIAAPHIVDDTIGPAPIMSRTFRPKSPRSKRFVMTSMPASREAPLRVAFSAWPGGMKTLIVCAIAAAVAAPAQAQTADTPEEITIRCIILEACGLQAPLSDT
jgi:hypothetical protein